MNVFQTLTHYGTYALAFYAFYVVLGSVAFGFFLWRRVFLHNTDSKGKGDGSIMSHRAGGSHHSR